MLFDVHPGSFGDFQLTRSRDHIFTIRIENRALERVGRAFSHGPVSVVNRQQTYPRNMDDLVVKDFKVRGADLEEVFETSGGPGGQHANRNETAVRLRLDIATASIPADPRERLQAKLGDVVEVVVSDSRSQYRNRALARQRLRDKLEAALVDPPERRPSKPTRGSKTRRLNEKKARSQTKRLRRKPAAED